MIFDKIQKAISSNRNLPDFSFQLKVRGDAFGGHFVNGISMSGSESVNRCKKVSHRSDKTVYECEKYRVEVHHEEKGNVTECFTVFEKSFG